ncbi:M81 family metallopeptidase (plasmid) [Sinorhizobium medicae]|uniref:M81 family metallopeptidase n=1 Tax=Sinorhizobium medicae TaxID=110321 RepID=UPI002AF6CBC0|nr:M81 family metallopeptidase [Sinorhizobium medicae]WQO88524.1 M81 family metallopeptidase [Sinorhizobium medicae]
MRIGIARLWHEANSFTPTSIGLGHFQEREFAKGGAGAEAFRDTSIETAGAFRWAHKCGAELIFSRLAASAPGGPVEQPVLDMIISEIINDPALDMVDGLYLSLHGSCLGTEDLSPEATLASRLRARFPGLPIVASFDMHCIPTPALADALDGATVYRRYPHTDMAETAERALDLLQELIRRGHRGKLTLARLDMVLPSFNMRTDEAGPMTEIEALALDLEAEAAAQGLPVSVYPFASFAYADNPETDSGVLVSNLTPGDPNATALTAEFTRSMIEKMRACAPAFRPDLPTAAEFLSARPWQDGRRWAILEPSDNPMSGGAGDTPGLLRAAIRTQLPEGAVFAFFDDPMAVAAARAAGVGARLSLQLGGRIDNRFGAPVCVDGHVEGLTEGRFKNTGPMETGIDVDLGPTAVIRTGPLRIILTSRCYSPNDPQYFHLHGIDPGQLPLLLVKAKNHFRASFGKLFDAFAQVETPGPAMADATKLPFRLIPPKRLRLPSRDRRQEISQ